MKDYNSNILIVGATPKTGGVGGVTVHIQRLLEFLDKNSVPYYLYDYKVKKPFGVFKHIRNSALVHIHVSNPYYRLYLTIVCKMFQKKLITTFHGKYTKSPRLKHWPIIKFTIKKATLPIVLNMDSYNTCRAINDKTQLIPAFIPPQIEEKLDYEILNMVSEIKNKNLETVVTYGYDISFDENGCEIYGIGFLISFFKEHNNKYALIISDPKGNYRNKYRDNYDNVYFITHPHSLYELMKITDIFIRNTSTDGDSLSVKEALYLKKRVLCSDSVDRPSGAELFHYSDSESLQLCLQRSTNNQSYTIESGEKKILAMYHALLNGK